MHTCKAQNTTHHKPHCADHSTRTCQDSNRHRQPPPTTNCQPPSAAHRHQPPTANRHQPPTAANRQPLFNTVSVVLCLAHVLTMKQRVPPSFPLSKVGTL